MFCRRIIHNCIQKNFFNNYKIPFYIIQNNYAIKFDDTPKNLFKPHIPNLYTVKRFKHKKKETLKQNQVFEEEEEEKEEEEEDELDSVEPYEKVIIRFIPSMRLDSVAKKGFSLPRNKIDTAYYESKLRLNGKKVLKKSVTVNEGDEVDMIIGKSPDNSDLLVIHRIRVLSIKYLNIGCKVKLIREKSMIIEQYTHDYNTPSE